MDKKKVSVTSEARIVSTYNNNNSSICNQTWEMLIKTNNKSDTMYKHSKSDNMYKSNKTVKHIPK